MTRRARYIVTLCKLIGTWYLPNKECTSIELAGERPSIPVLWIRNYFIPDPDPAKKIESYGSGSS